MKPTNLQVTIIGSGLAGLMSAYELALLNIPSIIISKAPLKQTNTWMAQGGVAAAISKTDSIEKHFKDTILAGDGLCIEENVKEILELGPELISKLISSGMIFDSDKGKISLGKEGGHHQRRILHVDDQTGRALHEFLLEKLQSSEFSKTCTFLPKKMVVSAVKERDQTFTLKLLSTDSQNVQTVNSSHLVLATGGAGKAFLYTSNWEGATGDGLKLAHDLGANLRNLEMVQFHPTCLHHTKARNFLISEALRGEGAKLLNEEGNRFMVGFHEDCELAPRDIVSRAIEHQIKSSGKDCVYLDITHHSKDFLQKRFPTIFEKCLELGIDISKNLIPVVPAAHYTCGGIETKNDLTSTSVPNLYAVGECGYTGLHGANRLASNSLLECLVTAHCCAQAIKNSNSKITAHIKDDHSKNLDAFKNTESLFLVNALWDEVRTIMWTYVGIQRSTSRLQQALDKISSVERQVKKWLSPSASRDICELENIIFFSKNCIKSALLRPESRGCHYNINYPLKNKDLLSTLVHQNNVSITPLK